MTISLVRVITFYYVFPLNLCQDVLELNDQNFEKELSNSGTTLVMFYAPWCPYCRKLKPDYEAAATSLEKNNPPITLAKIDCTRSGKSTCNEYGVSEFPTLKIFRNGAFSKEYDGPRETSSIVDFMRTETRPVSVELRSVRDLKDFLKKAKNDFRVVGYFDHDQGVQNAFMKIAELLKDKILFAHTTKREVLEDQGVKDRIVLYQPAKSFESAVVSHGGEDIDEFLRKIRDELALV